MSAAKGVTTSASPTPALLSRALVHLTLELEAAAGVGDQLPSLAVWSNVVRCVAAAGPDGLDERDLPTAARLSSRQAVSAVTGSARRGWINAAPVAGSGKHRHLHLTDTGRKAADVWPEHLAALDRQWKDSRLRTGLEDIVGRLPFELPHFPASYGSADPSAIGAPYAQGGKRTEGVPAHAQDWKPVARAEGDTVSMLPLTALLSQALMAFTVDYEDHFPWPLESTANVLLHVMEEPRPLADVPAGHGIAGNGKSLLERHLIVAVTPDPAQARRKLVALTDRGKAVLHHHPIRLEAVESQWRDHFGERAMASLRKELAPLAAPVTGPDHLMAPLHLG